MYKNLKSPDPVLNTLLANLSVGDTQHDFGYKNAELEDIKRYYDSGLPTPFNGINDEDICLSSIVQEYTLPGDNKPILNNQSKDFYVPMKISNPGFQHRLYNSHSIKTINNYSYNVSYTDVKPDKQIITSQEFFDQLNISTTDIAVVIDAASIAFLEILKSGEIKINGKIPNVYYIYGPEVINDPATKTQVDAKIFTNEGGVNLIPCLSTNSSSFVYHYDFTKIQDPNVVYLSQFFTNYQFDLSEIQKNKMGKTETMTTNLTVNYGNYNNVVIDSKSKNDISFLSSVLKNIVNLLTSSVSFINKIFKKSNTASKGKDIPKYQFDMNCAFQQKRSGDWLQVLLCSALNDKSRGFRDIRGKYITKDIQKVFLVTHDRIALAFALLNGIDVIFANHNSKQHFHSAFVFQLNDPIQELQNKKNLAFNYQGNLGQLNEKINVLKSMINEYQRTLYETYVNNNVRILNDSLENYIGRPLDNNLPSEFDVITKDVFPKALNIVLHKQLLPDLQPLIQKLDEYQNISLNSVAQLNVDTQYQEIIVLYNEINTTIENTNKLIEGVIKKFNNENSKILKNFKKSVAYVNALSWQWNNMLGKRQWELLTNILDVKGYKSDRNIFLYNLNDLPELVKQKIAYLYFRFYNVITPLSPEQTNISELKFKAVTLSFCVEVLLTMGGNGVDGVLTPQQIIDTMDGYISGKKTNPFDVLLNDVAIVEENNDFNKELNENLYVGTGIANEVTEDLNEDQSLIQNSQNGSVTPESSQTSFSDENNERKVNFELNTKQATYPLMTTIILNDHWVENVVQTNKEFLENTILRPESELQKSVSSGVVPKTRGVVTRSMRQMVTRSMRGGELSKEEKIENLQQLNELLTPLLPNLTPTQVTISQDVFKDTSICFHPLLPIYMITDAYYTSICNDDDITESWDMDLFLNYFEFLKTIKNQVVNSYSSNTNLDKLTAYVIGLGLKELFFTSNNDNIGYHKCLQVLKINSEVYSSVSSLTEVLVSRISGKINQTEQERQIGLKVLESNILIDFGELVGTDEIFTKVNNVEINLDDFKQQVLNFSLEIANKIMQDRDMKSLPPSSVPSPVSTNITTSSSSSKEPILSTLPIKRDREEYIPEREVHRPRFNEYPLNLYGNQWNMSNPWQQPGLVYGGIRKKTRKYINKNKKHKYTKRSKITKKSKKTKKNKKRRHRTWRKRI